MDVSSSDNDLAYPIFKEKDDNKSIQSYPEQFTHTENLIIKNETKWFEIEWNVDGDQM